jgi:hypothetical protein
MIARTWPTPAARDFKGVDRQETDRGNARPLNEVASMWSTPHSSDGEKGGPNQSFGAGGIPLASQTVQWPTPRSHEVGNYQYSRGDRAKPVPTLTGVALSGRQGHPTRMPGRKSSDAILTAYRRYRATTDLQLRAEMRALIRLALRAEKRGERRTFTRPSFRRSLNATFVGWLMGWCRGWTSFECSATELSRFKQRMRSALSQLDLPDEVPVQRSLFG